MNRDYTMVCKIPVKLKSMDKNHVEMDRGDEITIVYVVDSRNVGYKPHKQKNGQLIDETVPAFAYTRCKDEEIIISLDVLMFAFEESTNEL